jgi:ketosteroid isomerase-like protein
VLVGTNAKGHRFELPAMLRLWVSDGLITRLDEYFDSAHIATIVG